MVFKKIRRYYLLWFGMMLCGLLVANHSNAFMKTSYNFKDGHPVVSATTSILWIDAKKYCMDLGENIFYCAEFEIEGEKTKSRLEDTDGNSVELSYFKKGDRVKVLAFETEKKNTFIIDTLKKLPPR